MNSKELVLVFVLGGIVFILAMCFGRPDKFKAEVQVEHNRVKPGQVVYFSIDPSCELLQLKVDNTTAGHVVCEAAQ